MDYVETSSNSSRDSRISECFSSSNISDLSGYQGEFLQLRHALNPDKYASDCTINNKVVPKTTKQINLEKCNILYEERITKLTAQLQSALKQNEKYKNDIYNLEKKTELAFNDKIEKLLERNSQLETNLNIANKQIERLIQNLDAKSRNSGQPQLDNRVLQLESLNTKLNHENFILSTEINSLKIAHKESTLELDHLKVELNELKLELTAKTNCVVELKEKISEQHIELENALRKNATLQHSYDAATFEIESLKKSEGWYKNQLNQCQSEKVMLSQQFCENKKSLACKEEEIAKLNLELNKWKCECERIQLKALKEKQNLLKQIQNIDIIKDINETKTIETNITPIQNNDIKAITNYYETTLSDLSDEVARIKLNYEEQQTKLTETNKKYTDLLSKYLLLQKKLQDREAVIEQLEILIKDLKMKLEISLNQSEESKNQNIILKSTISELEIKLRSEVEEKYFVQESVKCIKEQFKVFKKNYDALNDELNKKNKEILNLQAEKQELFMSNNWKTCELEKITHKELQLKALQEQLEIATQKCNELQLQNSQLHQNIDTLNFENKELENMAKTIQDAHRKVEINENVRKLAFNNYANLQTFDDISIIEILEYISKLCKLNLDSEDLTINDKTEHIRSLLRNIENTFQWLEKQISLKDLYILDLEQKIHKLKRDLIAQVNKIKTKVKLLQERTEENVNLLNVVNVAKISGENNEDIKHLQALLQVKIREQNEKQKKYETNYRTLLRKVKEHMKGRNAAEKHNIYLQELHNNLSDEHNSLKLQIETYTLKIKSMEALNEDYCNTIDRLKKKIISLENKVNESSQCQNCLTVKDNISDLEIILQEKDNSIHKLQSEKEMCTLKLQEYESIIKMNERVVCDLKNTNLELKNKLIAMEKSKELQEAVLIKLKNEFEKEKEVATKMKLERIDLINTREDFLEKNRYLSRELELSNSLFHQKCEEITELEKRFKSRSEENANIQDLVDALKIQLQLHKNEIESLKGDKIFLHRLCNDLKTALKIQVSQYKLLKEYVSSNLYFRDKEKAEYSSLPQTISNFPSPSTKYDDMYIEKLLQENNILLQDKPLGDIQGCLNTLRNEILVLQKQIVQKNCVPDK